MSDAREAPSVSARRPLTAQGSRRLGIAGSGGRAGGIPTVVFSSHKLFVTVGGAAAFYSAALSCAPTHAVTVRPTNVPPGLRVSPSLHVFSRADWRSPRVFRVAAPGSHVLDDHGGALAGRDPHRLLAVEHVSSSLDARFQSPRVLLVPSAVCVQVNTRLGCCVFTAGQATTTRSPGKVAPSAHEFVEMELSVDDQAGWRKPLVAKSTVLVQTPSTPKATTAAMAAMAAVEAANVATARTAEMLERRRTRQSLLLQPSPTTASRAAHSSAPLSSSTGGAPVGGGAYSAISSLVQEASSSTIVTVASRGSHSVLLFKGGALLSLGKLLETDAGAPDRACSSSSAVISLQASAGADAALSRMLVDVACGDHHVVAITEQGYLLTWGDARDGRLGHGGAVSTGAVSTSADGRAVAPEARAAPAAVREPQVVRSLLHKRIVHVACGARHSMALAEDGDVFSWGHGACGALGHGGFETVDAPRAVEALRGQRVARVACGDMHTAVLLASGALLTCGWSEHGRLGRACNPEARATRAKARTRGGDYFDDDDANDRQSSSYSPRLLPVDMSFVGRASAREGGSLDEAGEEEDKCTFVTCGAAHTLLRTAAHRVLAFGWNVSGQLGVGDCRSRWAPTPVEYFAGGAFVVSALAAGKLHSLAALQDGRLLAWGSDELGQCGVGSFPQVYTVPHLVASMAGLHVSQLAAADAHSLVLTLAAQRHLDALEASHPARYAQLAERCAAAVREDAARRALVFARARETQRRHEARARRRRPPGVVALGEAAASLLSTRAAAAVAMAGASASLARVLVEQARVEQDVAGFERAQPATLDGTRGSAVGERRRPHTASATLRSRPCKPPQQPTASGTDDDGGTEKNSSDVRDDEEEVPYQPMTGVRPHTADARRAVRCSSAALWRQSRLLTLQVAATSATRPATVSRMSKEARAQLGALLDGVDQPQSQAEQAPAVDARLLRADGERGGALMSGALAAMEQQREAAWFSQSRPKSAPSRARTTRAS